MPRLDTFAKLLAAANHALIIVNDHGIELEFDREHERLIDRGGRQFPAHLDTVAFDKWEPFSWWGWSRIAWGPWDKTVPTHALIKRHRQQALRSQWSWDGPELMSTVT